MIWIGNSHTNDKGSEYTPVINTSLKGGPEMSRRRSVMSDQLKVELAKDLGFYETVQNEGWANIRAKDAGNMVKRAIQLAEQAASRK